MILIALIGWIFFLIYFIDWFKRNGILDPVEKYDFPRSRFSIAVRKWNSIFTA